MIPAANHSRFGTTPAPSLPPAFGRSEHAGAGTVAATVLGLLMQWPGAMAAQDSFVKGNAADKSSPGTRTQNLKEWPGVRITANSTDALESIRSITGPDDWYTSIEGAISGSSHDVTVTLTDDRPLRSSQISLGEGPNRLTVDYRKGDSGADNPHPSLLDLFSVNGQADDLILNEGPYVMTLQADVLDRITLIGKSWRKDDNFSSVSLAETAFVNDAGGTVTVQWGNCGNIRLKPSASEDGLPVDCHDKPLEQDLP